MPRLTESQRKKLIAMVTAKGMSIRSAAKAIGLSHEGARKILFRAGYRKEWKR